MSRRASQGVRFVGASTNTERRVAEIWSDVLGVARVGVEDDIIELGGDSFTVGALVQSNFGSRPNLMVRGVPVGKHWPEDAPLSQRGALLDQSNDSAIIRRDR